MPGLAADFPDAFIRLLPDSSRYSMNASGMSQADSRPLGRSARREGGVHELAEDVELELAVGGVADTTGAESRSRAATGHSIRSAAARRRCRTWSAIGRGCRRRRATAIRATPAPPRKAGLHGGAQQKRGVPHPAETVIPVALSAELFGQRGGGAATMPPVAEWVSALRVITERTTASAHAPAGRHFADQSLPRTAPSPRAPSSGRTVRATAGVTVDNSRRREWCRPC